jgi:hypothetical protein
MKEQRACIRQFYKIWTVILLVTICLAAPVYGADIRVNNNNDSVNGDVTSPESLAATPGNDGISLREAIQAANNAPGPHSIRFASELKGTTIFLQGDLPWITRDHIAIYGDIDSDGAPDITINGAWLSGACFRINASFATISHFNISNFSDRGVQVFTNGNAPHLVKGITVTGNRITTGWYGISVANQNNNGVIRDVTINGNSLVNNGFAGIYIGAGGERFSSGNSISNVAITGNTITTNTGDKLSVMIFGATMGGGKDNVVTGITISKNIMSDLLLISGGNALGCQRNRVENVVIAENSIQVSPMAIEILGGAQDSTNPSQGESTCRLQGIPFRMEGFSS